MLLHIPQIVLFLKCIVQLIHLYRCIRFYVQFWSDFFTLRRQQLPNLKMVLLRMANVKWWLNLYTFIKSLMLFWTLIKYFCVILFLACLIILFIPLLMRIYCVIPVMILYVRKFQPEAFDWGVVKENPLLDKSAMTFIGWLLMPYLYWKSTYKLD